MARGKQNDNKRTRKQRSNCRPRSRKDENRDESKTKEVNYNDPSWYNNNGQLAFDAGNMSFGQPMGARILDYSVTGKDVTMPGIMTIGLSPSIGVCADPFAPANIASRALYDRVNYKNSRNFSYEAPDLMMTVLAFNQLYAFHAWMRRLYGIANVYSQYNRYVPSALLLANGVAVDEQETIEQLGEHTILGRLADFRYYINLFARKANAFCVPNGMSLFDRTYWLYSNVYADEDSRKAGMYMFIPDYLWKFNETGTEFGASLDPIALGKSYEVGGSLLTLEEIMRFGDNLLEPLFQSQDVNNISTDIMKAYENNLVTLPDTPEDYIVDISYSPEVLNQINNATVISGYRVLQGMGHVTQNPNNGTLIFAASTDQTHVDKVKNIIMNTHILQPSPDDVLVMSRLTTKWKTSGNVIVLESSGTEIPTSMNVFVFEDLGDTKHTLELKQYDIGSTLANNPSMKTLGLINKFKDHPLFRVLHYNASTEKFDVDELISDVDNFTVVDSADLYNLHEVAIMSEFNVPVSGSNIK